MSKGSKSGGGHSNQNHHANQMNPNNAAYKSSVDNRSNQMNPNNSAYHSSRGEAPAKK